MTIIRLPGLIDPHVHLRVPGGEHKEDFISGCKASLAGGFTTVLAMPNTNPPITTPLGLKENMDRVKHLPCDIRFFAGVSIETIEQLPEMSHQAVALKIYMNDTYGPLRMNEPGIVAKCFETWGSRRPIALHAEGEMIEMGINLAKEYGRRTHFCHVSRQQEIELIARAKLDGAPITCEVTPHHLFLTDRDAATLGPLGDMRPTLGSQKDVDALWDHIETTIDCIASDHAPHTLEEKHSMKSPPGVPGLETSLPLMFSAAYAGKISLERLVELMDRNPRMIYGIENEPDTWIEIDADRSYVITNNELFTKCKWSPFAGKRVTGKVVRVVRKNRTVFDSGEFFYMD